MCTNLSVPSTGIKCFKTETRKIEKIQISWCEATINESV